VLRHKPEIIGLQLDESGWAAIADLVAKSKSAGVSLSGCVGCAGGRHVSGWLSVLFVGKWSLADGARAREIFESAK